MKLDFESIMYKRKLTVKEKYILADKLLCSVSLLNNVIKRKQKSPLIEETLIDYVVQRDKIDVTEKFYQKKTEISHD